MGKHLTNAKVEVKVTTTKGDYVVAIAMDDEETLVEWADRAKRAVDDALEWYEEV